MNKQIKILFFIFLTSSILSCSIIQKTEKEKIDNQTIITDTISSRLPIYDNIDDRKFTSELIENEKIDTLSFIEDKFVEITKDIKDDTRPIFNNNLDSLYHLWYVRKNLSQNNREEQNFETENISDSVYIKRLQKLPALFPLSYNNIVKRYIEIYSKRRKRQVEIMLGRSEYYFPIFEEILDKEGLPLELKYLPIIESALNPKAFSRAGASGLWQFMYPTGKMYGLKVNSYIDERRDPVKASYAAAKYLKDLYKIYGDWALVIAAYNCGPGNVNKAIRRSGGKRNYWDIYYRLPKETRGYVPAFIGAMYAFEYHKEHNMIAYKSTMPGVCDTIHIQKMVHFKQISKIIGISIDQLRELNPQYRADVIPGNTGVQTLKLPYQYSGKFIDNEDEIYEYKKDYYTTIASKIANPKNRYSNRPHISVKGRDKLYYTVKPGDATGLIATWFNVRTSDLRYWNNIRRNLIKVGQKLVIYVPKGKASKYSNLNNLSYKQKQASIGKTTSDVKAVKQILNSKAYVYYTVRKGDNFWNIAKKFSGISNIDIMKLNNINNPAGLKIGQELKIRSRS